MSVASWSGSLLAWEAELSALKARVGRLFGRRELKESAAAFLDGVLSGIERKTGWLLAEQAGAARPYRMQSLLGRSRWAADELMHEVRSYAVEALGDPDGVLVVDETGFLKKGTHSVGVGRQYSGTAGRIENCQVGVFLSYASRFGHALIDRRLYLPKDWAEDDGRRAKAAVPDEQRFVTKPEIARDLIATALEAGIPCAYVLADALYGSDKSLRVMLEQRQQPHVLAVRSNERLMAGSFQTRTAAEIADAVAPADWQRLAAGEGAKGPRLYDWARVRLFRLQQPAQRFDHWLLVRRSLRDPSERAYYVVFAPADVRLAELAGVAGLRWTIETCFETAKDDLGLDHCEARSWHAWHRHMTLVMAALAFLAKLRADLLRTSMPEPVPGKRNERSLRLVGAHS
jgi:SRSO17 transposase